MKIIIEDKSRAVLFNNVFYDTNVEIDVPLTEALRLTRLYNIRAQWDKHEYDPLLWKEKKIVNITADVDFTSGWGNVSRHLLLDGSRHMDMRWNGRMIEANDYGITSIARKDIHPNAAMLWHEQPKNSWCEKRFPRNGAITMFETTHVPPSWIHSLNHMDFILVPCKQNVEMMRNSKVTPPIEVIHWGVDDTMFYEMERSNDVFTFGSMGALSVRKGTDMLVKAFLEAFPTQKDVKLLLKTSYNIFPFAVKDPRVEVQMMPVSHGELIDSFVKKVDCFVFPTRGEGFGLPPLEMMATGVPVIITNWSGPVEYMNEDVGWLLDYKLVRASNFTDYVYKEECGDWAEPSYEQLVDMMRYAYNHQDEVKAKGKAAAEYVKKNWLWKQKILTLVDALEKHL